MRARLFLVAVGVVVAGGPLAGLAWAASQYTVQPGDTLTDIAARVRIPLAELAAANGIDDPDLVLAGQVLVLPGARGSAGAAGYVVRRGDTLLEVADRLGVPAARLAEANGLRDPDLLPAGKVLVLPAGGGAAGGAAGGAGGGGASGSYVVRPGDALLDVAARLGVPMAELVAANGIADPDLLPVGKVLTVPRAWRCPVQGPVSFVNDFGYVRPGTGIPHQGVDLFAPRGTPVVAPVSGVAGRYPNDKGGLAFQLFGDDGVRYYGAHLDRWGAVGPVRAGTVIGYVGDSGDARGTAPHLHFEAHPGGGAAANPYPKLQGACR